MPQVFVMAQTLHHRPPERQHFVPGVAVRDYGEPMTLDETTVRLSQLVATLAEDTNLVLAGDEGAVSSPPFEALAKRRADVYAAVLAGQARSSMVSTFDAWVVDLARAMAPISPPDWLPMGDVLRAHVTLEAGARGFRSLFSDKPSDKETARVTRLGTLAVRLLRQVVCAEGRLNSDDARMIGAFVASLGLSPEAAGSLLNEPVMPGLHLDVYGDIEPKVLHGLLQGAWLAAASDGLHPREEEVIRKFASSAGLPLAEVEEARAAAIARVEAKRLVGLAANRLHARRAARPPPRGRRDHPRAPRAAPPASTLPRRGGRPHRPRRAGRPREALGKLDEGRADTRPRDDRAAALHEDPSLGRQALVRARFEHVADDLESDGREARTLVTGWMSDVLAATAKGLAVPPRR